MSASDDNGKTIPIGSGATPPPMPPADDETSTSIDELIASGELPAAVVAAIEREREHAREADARAMLALADTENTRKRLTRERAEAVRYANESLLNEMLPIIDSLQLALTHATRKADVKALRKGVELTLRQFGTTLKKLGVEQVAVKVGDPFDAALHEATMQDAEAKLPANTVANVLQVGYRYHDRLLRPARVAVAKGKG